MEEYGQIRMGTPFGDAIYNLCFKNPSVFTVVEIGTWKGLGSTECIIRGLYESEKKEVSFISLEADERMYKTALSTWSVNLPSWTSLIHGRIVEPEEMDSTDLGLCHPDEKKWFIQDEAAFRSCPNVFSSLPSKIDFLFLDGGEFSTYQEYIKLKDRSIFIGMDDTVSRKCRKIREEILSNPDHYEIVIDNPWYRNGVMICRSKLFL